MSKKGLKTMLVCIVLLIGLVTLFACNKSDVTDKDGQTKVIVKIQNEDGSIYKENVVFSDLFTLSLQKEGYTGRLYRDADFLKPLTKDSKVKNGDTVYVKWTINSYTVTFMDGKTVLKTEKVQHGSAATAPEVPEQDGKTFKKWDKDFSKVTEDIEVSAVYELNVYTVVFKNGETTLKTEKVKHGDPATPPKNNPPDTPTAKFVRWDKSFDNVTSDIIVNAEFETKKFTLTFINYDGTPVHAAEVEYGASVSGKFDEADKAATYDDTILDYVGWYDKSDTEKTIIDDFSELTMPTRDLTYVLKLRLLDPAIGDFTVNTPADFTFAESSTAEFTVTPNEGTKLYDGVTYKYIWTINKGNGIYKTVETTVPSLKLQNPEAGEYLAAGEYFASVKIVASIENCGSVEKEFAGKTLVVSRAEISGIKVTGGTFTYGDETAKINVTGTEKGDKVQYKVDDNEYADTVYLSTLDAGEHKYSVKVTRNENYNVYESKTLTMKINRASVTVVVTPEKTEVFYGDNLPNLSAKINGKEVSTLGPDKYSLSKGEEVLTMVATKVGEYDISNVTFEHADYPAKNYDVTVKVDETKKTIEVSKAPLTVTIEEFSVIITYGEDLPEISYTFEGLKLSDKKQDFTVNIVTEYKTKSPVNDYTLTAKVSGTKAGYYTISVNTISFNIAKKSAKIIVDKVDDIIYGDKVPVLSATVKDVLEGDTLDYSLTTTYQYKAVVGTYEVNVDKKAEVNTNYAIDVEYTNKTFKVTPRDLSICFSGGIAPTDTTYTIDRDKLTIDNLVAGDTVTGYISITKTKEDAGVYTDIKDFDLKNLVIDNADCYNVTYSLSVEFIKYILPIKYDNKTVDYNGQEHGVAVEITGEGKEENYTITYGMTEDDCTLTSSPVYKNANADGYKIYFKVVDKTTGAKETGSIKLTINKAKITVKVVDVTITYGDPLPTFTYTHEKLFAGDTISGTAQYSGAGTNAGAYTISVEGLDAGQNYEMIVSSGTLTINPKSVDVTWNIEESYVYNPDVQILPTAKFNGINSEEISARVTFSGQATEFKDAGTYTVTASDDSGNYILNNSVITVVIAKADYVDITHKSLSGVYDPNKTLKGFTLENGFRWKDSTEKPVCGKPEYDAIYNGDSANYNDFELKIKINLQKAQVALKVNVLEFVFDNTAHEVGTTVTYKGEVLDATVYKLKYEKSSFIDAGTFRTRVTMEAQNYDLPKDTYLYVKVKGVKIGSTYYTIEDALFNSISGDTVEFISAAKEVSFAPLDIATAIYADKAYRTVKAGVTLKLASDEDNSMSIGKPTYGNGSTRYVDTDSSKIKQKLILNESTAVEVYGNILIQGLLGFSNQAGYQGHTSGSHSQIINDGTINLNNGAILDLRGYIKGTGKVEARSGAKVYSPFVVRDFRGGSSSSGTYYSGVSPFNVYEMPNIQCLYGVNYGATHTAYMDLFGGGKHNNVTNNAIASNSAVIILKEGSRLIKTYDRDSEKSTLTIYGNVELGDLSMEVSGATIKMSDVRFPIPWNYTINIGDGIVATSFAVKYDYKIMTGATVNVKKNATVNLTGTVVIYKEFTDQAYAGWVYPNKEPAKFCVEGKVSVNGKLVSKAGIAGEITGLNGGKVIIGKYVNLQLSSKEGHATNILPTSFVKVATISAKAELVNADGKIITAETSKTYNYNNGMWQQ